MFGCLGLASAKVVGGWSSWCTVVAHGSSIADWSVEQRRSEMSLFLGSGLVVLIDLFIAADALFEFFVDCAALGNRGFLNTEVVNVDSLFVHGGVSLVVGDALISEDVGMELLLLLQVGIDFGGSNVDWLLLTALSLPVSVRSESSLGIITFVFDWGLVLVTTAKHARLELLVLLVLAVEPRLLVHTRSSRFVRALLTSILPVSSCAHEAAIPLVVLGAVL